MTEEVKEALADLPSCTATEEVDLGTVISKLMEELEESKRRISKALAEAPSSDGSHHKQYAIDQMVRALTGCPVVDKTVTLTNGKEYAYKTQGVSDEYKAWVEEYQGDFNPEYDCFEYEWDVGIA